MSGLTRAFNKTPDPGSPINVFLSVIPLQKGSSAEI